MRTWRVGSFSMGFTLVVAGLCMIGGLFAEVGIPSWLLKWWPVILILLGIEIVAANFFKPEQFRYDGFSIFIVLVILVAGTTLYAVQSSGALERGRQMFTSQAYPFQYRQNIVLENETALLRIKSPGPQVTLLPYDGKDIVLLMSGSVTANSQEAADQTGSLLYIVEQVNNELNLMLHQPPRPSAFRHINDYLETVLYVPRTLPLTLEQSGGRIDIETGEIRADWTIQGDGRLFLSVGENADFTLIHQQPELLFSHGSEKEEKEAPKPQVQKHVFGNGTHTLTVHTSSPVEIAER